MHWHGIYIGPTTPALRQMIAGRAEFYLTDEHEQVLALFGDKAGFIVHPSTLVESFGWKKYRAIRVLEEIAEAFALPSGTVSSPHGEAEVYVWGRVIESGAWKVRVEEVTGGFSVRSTSPVTVPVPPPAPPVTSPSGGLEAAARRALEGTRITSMDAAKGLIRYAVKDLGMDPEGAATALIDLSAAGRGATRAALAEHAGADTGPASAESVDVDMEFARARKAGELSLIEEEHPELAVGVAVVRELNEARKYYPVSLAEVRAWDEDIRGNIRCPEPEEVTRAVREALEGYGGDLGVEYVGRIMRRYREERDVEARRQHAMMAGASR